MTRQRKRELRKRRNRRKKLKKLKLDLAAAKNATQRERILKRISRREFRYYLKQDD